MDYVYEKLLQETSNYRKDYLDYIIKKYVYSNVPDYVIDIRTLKVLQFEGQEPRIPAFGNLTTYSCESAQQLILGEIKQIKHLQKTDHIISVKTKEVLECAVESFTESSDDENEDIDTSESKFPICDLQLTRRNEVSNKDLDNNQKKFSECGKKTASVIAVRKNPGFKRNLDFLKSYPVDDLSFKSSSFSEISNSNKKVPCSSISSSSTDKQRKDKYPVKTKSNNKISYSNLTEKSITYFPNLQTPQNPVDDVSFKSNSLSEISNSNKKVCCSSITSSSTDKQRKDKYPVKTKSNNKISYSNLTEKSITYFPKLQTTHNPVDDVSFESNSLSEVSNSDKNVQCSSITSSSTDKQRKDKYPVKTKSNNKISYSNLTEKSITYFPKLQTPHNPVDDVSFKSSSFSEISNSNKKVCRNSITSSSTDKQRKDKYPVKTKSNIKISYSNLTEKSITYFPKGQTCQYPVDELSFNSRSFSGISNSNKKVCRSSISTSSTDKQRQDKYPVKTKSNNKISYSNLTEKSITYFPKLQTPHNPVDDVSFKSSSFSEISNSNKKVCRNSITSSSTDKQRQDKYPVKTKSNNKISYSNLTEKSITYVPKWQTCQYPVDELSFNSSSFSEISNSNKKVRRSSISSSSTDKQRQDQCPVTTKCNNKISYSNVTEKSITYFPKLQICLNRVDDLPFSSSSFSEISNSNKASNSSTSYFNKWKTGQYNGEEIVIHKSKTLYANNKISTTSSVLNSCSGAYECDAKFRCETLCIIRAAKLKHPHYHKPKKNDKPIDKQKMGECPAKNGLAIINYATKSSNNSYSMKMRNKERSCHENSKKIVEKKFSTCKRNVNQNIVCGDNTLKVPRVILRKLQYNKYA